MGTFLAWESVDEGRIWRYLASLGLSSSTSFSIKLKATAMLVVATQLGVLIPNANGEWMVYSSGT